MEARKFKNGDKVVFSFEGKPVEGVIEGMVISGIYKVRHDGAIAAVMSEHLSVADKPVEDGLKESKKH